MLLGIIFVIIFLSFLILVHELGHFLVAKKFGLLVEEFGFGLPPRLWGKKIGETVYSVNALPFGGFVKILGEDREGGAIYSRRNFNYLSAGRRTAVIAAGVSANFLVGWLIISFIFLVGVPQALLVTQVQAGSPAEERGISIDDKIIGVRSELAQIESEITANRFVEIVETNKGKEITVLLERHGEINEMKVKPRLAPPVGEGALGIGFVEVGVPKMNLIKGFWEGLKTSLDIIRRTAIAIFDLIVKALVGRADLSQITGPVGIVKITAQSENLGFIYLFQLLALISLNLAVINIFPFPALDGGRLLFIAIEKIKGSPLPQKFERYANALGMALLLLFIAVITIKDIAGLF